MHGTRRVLVVDDSPEMVDLVADALEEAGFEVIKATDGAAAIEAARLAQPDVAITDLRMPMVDGLDVLAGLRALDPELPVVIMTAFGSIDSAVEAMRRGAWTYLSKPFRTDELVLHAVRAAEERRLSDQNRALRRATVGAAPPGMLGRSPEMSALFSRIARLTETRAHVLIRGESGTGKELVARALHAAGGGEDKPFVPVNCASVPAALLESELFGHVRGAFTGATGQRRGLFLEAEGGTIFLDEIGDLPLELQGHLLRVLEDRVVRPVGADRGRAIDVRILAATHQDLEARVGEGRFRADLFYRLEVFPLHVPPLRARAGDIALLAASFLEKARSGRPQKLAVEVLEAFERHPWPGNVRELENVVRRLAFLVDGPEVRIADVRAHVPHLLPPAGSPVDPPALVNARTALPTLRELEDEYLAWVVAQCNGNKTRAAEILGVDVSTIHRRSRPVE